MASTLGHLILAPGTQSGLVKIAVVEDARIDLWIRSLRSLKPRRWRWSPYIRHVKGHHVWRLPRRAGETRGDRGGPVPPGPHECQFLGGTGGDPKKIQEGAFLTNIHFFVVVFLLVSVVIKHFIPRFVIARRPKSAQKS